MDHEDSKPQFVNHMRLGQVTLIGRAPRPDPAVLGSMHFTEPSLTRSNRKWNREISIYL